MTDQPAPLVGETFQGNTYFRLRLVSHLDAERSFPERNEPYLKWLNDRGLPPPQQRPAGHPYVAQVNGTSLTYGLRRAFMSYTVDGNAYCWRIPPGIYEIQKHRDGVAVRGFVLLKQDGQMEPLDIYEVVKRVT